MKVCCGRSNGGSNVFSTTVLGCMLGRTSDSFRIYCDKQNTRESSHGRLAYVRLDHHVVYRTGRRRGRAEVGRDTMATYCAAPTDTIDSKRSWHACI